MSEQIREQVSVFLDGELPAAETELLLKRLMRDAQLRECFSRYCMVGEVVRNLPGRSISQGFAARVNARIDGEPAVAPAVRTSPRRWWRPAASVALAASVAGLAMFALQRRAEAPVTARLAALPAPAVSTTSQRVSRALTAVPGEAAAYTVPYVGSAPAAVSPSARLTSYVFAHSKYSSTLGQRGAWSGVMLDAPTPKNVEDRDAANSAP